MPRAEQVPQGLERSPDPRSGQPCWDIRLIALLLFFPVPVVGATALLLALSPLDPRPLSVLSPDLQPLVRALQQRGFRVRIALPPRPGAYGEFEARSRTIWVSPLGFELGIGRQVFLHEAVHAVQSCPGGVVRPLGWRLPVQPEVERGIRVNLLHAYAADNWLVEQEAFALPAQKDAVARLLQAVGQRCGGPRP